MKSGFALGLLISSAQTLGRYDTVPLVNYVFAALRHPTKVKKNILSFVIWLVILTYTFLISENIEATFRILIFYISIYFGSYYLRRRPQKISSYKFVLFIVLLLIIEKLFLFAGIKSPLTRINSEGLLLFSEPSYAALTILTLLFCCTDYFQSSLLWKIIGVVILFCVFYLIRSTVGYLICLGTLCVILLPKRLYYLSSYMGMPVLIIILVFWFYLYSDLIVNFHTEAFRFLTLLLSIMNLYDTPWGSGTIFVNEIFDIGSILGGIWDSEYVKGWKSLSGQAPAANLMFHSGAIGLFSIYLLHRYMYAMSKKAKVDDEYITRYLIFYTLLYLQSTLSCFLLPLVIYNRIYKNVY